MSLLCHSLDDSHCIGTRRVFCVQTITDVIEAIGRQDQLFRQTPLPPISVQANDMRWRVEVRTQACEPDAKIRRLAGQLHEAFWQRNDTESELDFSQTLVRRTRMRAPTRRCLKNSIEFHDAATVTAGQHFGHPFGASLQASRQLSTLAPLSSVLIANSILRKHSRNWSMASAESGSKDCVPSDYFQISSIDCAGKTRKFDC